MTEKPQITMRILPTGAMHGDRTWFLLKPGITLADRHHIDMPRIWTEVPTHAVLIEHREAGLILWDTGLPADWRQRWAPTGLHEYFPVTAETAGIDGFLDAALARLELTPADIDMLVLSHLHVDHAANAKLFDNGHTRIVVGADELEGATSFDGPFRGSHIKGDYEGLPFETVSGDAELAPGVTVIQTPGHTWGTMSLLVELANDGPKLFTSDAVYMRESWGPPAAGAAIVWDNVRWLESVEKLRSITERTGAELIFGHDENQHRHDLRLSPHGHYS